MVIISGLNITILVFVISPAFFSFLLIFIEKSLRNSQFKKNLSHLISFIGTSLDFILGFSFCNFIINQGQEIFNDTSFLILQSDITSLFFILLFTIIHLAVSIFSINFMNDYDDLAMYYALLFAVVTGLNLIVMASDFFTLFVAYEVMALCAYSIVGYYRNQESSEAGFKYLIMSSTGSLIILYGLALLYGATGRLDFNYFASVILEFNIILSLAVILLIIGFGITAAIFFLNTWLPDAHPAAPPPSSVILSGIIVLAGIYGILRTLILFILPIKINHNILTNLLIMLGIITSLQGNIFVLVQLKRTDPHGRNLKRILAFSTISHMGYLLTGLGTLNILGISGVLLHAFNHAIAKGVMFMIAGYLILATGSNSLNSYRGFGRQNPLIGTCLVISLFSLASIPLTGGFWSKFQIILGIFENGKPIDIFAGISMLLISVLAVAGYLMIIKYLIMDNLSESEKSEQGINRVKLKKTGFMKFTIVILTLIIVVLGVFPVPLIELALQASKLFFK